MEALYRGRRCQFSTPVHSIYRALLLLLLGFAVSAHAQLSPRFLGCYDFQNDDISVVLGVLARQGNIKLVIPGKLRGTVTLRVDHKTSREVFDMVVASKNLIVDKRDGTLYVSRRRTAQLPPHFPK